MEIVEKDPLASRAHFEEYKSFIRTQIAKLFSDENISNDFLDKNKSRFHFPIALVDDENVFINAYNKKTYNFYYADIGKWENWFKDDKAGLLESIYLLSLINDRHLRYGTLYNYPQNYYILLDGPAPLDFSMMKVKNPKFYDKIFITINSSISTFVFIINVFRISGVKYPKIAIKSYTFGGQSTSITEVLLTLKSSSITELWGSFGDTNSHFFKQIKTVLFKVLKKFGFSYFYNDQLGGLSGYISIDSTEFDTFIVRILHNLITPINPVSRANNILTSFDIIDKESINFNFDPNHFFQPIPALVPKTGKSLISKIIGWDQYGLSPELSLFLNQIRVGVLFNFLPEHYEQLLFSNNSFNYTSDDIDQIIEQNEYFKSERSRYVSKIFEESKEETAPIGKIQQIASPIVQFDVTNFISDRVFEEDRSDSSSEPEIEYDE